MISFWILILGWVSAAGPQVDLAEAPRGNTAFSEGAYEQAAQSYLDRLESGQKHSDVYYNLGNALYRSGESGHALLAWRIAQRLSPRKGDAHANILRVQQELAGSVEPPSTLGPLLLGGGLSLREQAWGGAILLGCVGLLLIWGRRKGQFPVGIPALLLGGPGLVLAASAFLTLRAPPSLVVLESDLELRSAVGLSGGVLLRTLEEGSELRFVDQIQDFVLVEIKNGESGWLPSSRVGWVDPALTFPDLSPRLPDPLSP
jgi:hypothetical protein